jgi:hypothetical protein
MSELVCAWYDVYNRVPREMRDENSCVTQQWAECAYCGRTELRFGKLGRQTPLPKPPTPPEGFPF